MIDFIKSFKLKSAIFFLIAIAIVYLPEFFLYLKSNALLPFIEGFIFTLAFFTLPFILFHRYMKVYYLGVAFFMFLTPIVLFCMYYFNTNITKELLVEMKDTNPYEMKDLFTLYSIPICSAVIISVLIIWYVLKQLPSSIPFRKSIIVSAIAFLVLIVMSIYRFYYCTNISITGAPKYKVTYYSLIEYHPFSIFGHISGLRKDFAMQENYHNVLAKFVFHTQKNSKHPHREIIVLCIGETSRFHNWQLNGYSKETNPKLSLRNDIIVYSDFITAAGYTRGSVPIIITRAEPETYFSHLEEPSFLRVVKEAGFHSYWVSAQERYGWNSAPNSIHVADADSNYYALYEKNIKIEDRDMSLLAKFQNIINNDTGNICIVLHTLGSHFSYDERYPHTYKKFNPTLTDIGANMNNVVSSDKVKVALHNSYDNTIVQTDAFLDSAINILNRTNSVSSLMFVSDHGENLADDSRNLTFHPDPPTEYVAHIPGLVWLSPLYRSIYKTESEELLKAKNYPLSTIYIFHTILDMFNMNVAGYDSTKSFSSKYFVPKERMMFGYDSVRNYDRSIKQKMILK